MDDVAETVTLQLPDTVYLPARRMAEATRRPLTEVLVDALKAALPPLEGLSPESVAELVGLEEMDDDALWQVMLSRVPADQQRRLTRLLRKNKAGKLTESERASLAVLQKEADHVMLRKARAAVLLRFRGRRLPTLVELRKISRAK